MCDVGQTALHQACWKRREDCVIVLLEHGAEINKENTSGEWSAFIAIVIYRNNANNLVIYYINNDKILIFMYTMRPLCDHVTLPHMTLAAQIINFYTCRI